MLLKLSPTLSAGMPKIQGNSNHNKNSSWWIEWIVSWVEQMQFNFVRYWVLMTRPHLHCRLHQCKPAHACPTNITIQELSERAQAGLMPIIEAVILYQMQLHVSRAPQSDRMQRICSSTILIFEKCFEEFYLSLIKLDLLYFRNVLTD